METIDINRAGISDLELIRSIGMLTFIETFGPVNTPENLQKYLAENFTIEKLTSEINNPDSEFYLAYDGIQLIGYLKLNFDGAQTELKEKNAVEVERIYVLKEFHGKKAGQALMQKAFDIAQQRSADYIWLGVWEENKKAIAFYLKNGFRQFDSHSFTFGDDVQTDIMMRREL